MGETLLLESEVDDLIKRLARQWPGRGYSLLRRNCCHFADEMCRWLGVGRMPAWVNRLAGAGASLVDARTTVDRGLLKAEEKLEAGVDGVTRWLQEPVNLGDSPLKLVEISSIPGLLKAERKLESGVDDMTRWLEEPVNIGESPTKLVEISWLPGFYEPVDPDAAVARAATRAWSVVGSTEALPGPDEASDGWVCRRGRDGQRYWHHRALGPAPWEAAPDWIGQRGPAGQQPRKRRDGSLPPAESRGGALPSPEEAPGGWVFQESRDGRRFWHHRDLGEAPWAAGPVAEPRLEKASIVREASEEDFVFSGAEPGIISI